MESSVLADEIAAVAASMTHNEYRLSKLIGDFDASEAWHELGAISCAHWLSWRVGMGLGAARERVRVAKVLRTLPALDAAFEHGRLSYCKVRAMTRVATPANEAMLIEMAEHATGAELEKICRRFRTVVDAETQPSIEEADALRFVRVRTRTDGTVEVRIELPPEEGARLVAALDSAATACAKGASRVDGLMTMVEGWFADGARPRRGGAPNEVVLHVSAETPPYLENEDAGAVSNAAARRLCCDASVVPVLENARGEIVDVGRRHRTVPPAMRRALELERGRCCAFPGCTHSLYLDAHHVKHWLAGGATRRDNLVLLCRRHHTFVHEHGWRIEKQDGVYAFIEPKRGVIPRTGDSDRVALTERSAQHDAPRDIDVWAQASQRMWDPIDYVQVVDALAAMSFRGDVDRDSAAQSEVLRAS